MTETKPGEHLLWRSDDLGLLELPPPPAQSQHCRNEAGWQVLLDYDVYEWLTDDKSDAALRKRAYFCLRELAINGRCSRIKTVRGAGKGWLRTTLGGSGGNHYYLWWAAKGSPALDGAEISDRQVLVRRVRHHDETEFALDAGNASLRHLIELEEVLRPADDSPFTAEQLAIAVTDKSPVRIVQGYPGSGKTTALWLAGSSATGTKAIYLTYSRGLARTAEEYFRAFGPADTAIDVLTFEDLLIDLADAHSGSIDFMAPGTGAERLDAVLADFRQPLGPWAGHPDELYAELHAHTLGRALPMAFRGVPASDGPLLSGDDYRAARGPTIGDDAADRAYAIAQHLQGKRCLDLLFPGPFHARNLILPVAEPPPPRFDGVTSVLVDEVQDLTQVEAMLVLTLAARIGAASGTMPSLVLAGDEAQTVRPTDFKWGWFGDLLEAVLGKRLAARTDHPLSANLRSPRAIASVIESTRSQYRLFDKSDRPSGLTYTDVDEKVVGRVLYCRATAVEDWRTLVEFFNSSPSAQLVYPGYRVPPEMSGHDSNIVTSDQVKGLDYGLVGVLDAGQRQSELLSLAEQTEANPLLALWGRTLADQFRVAVSRATDTLIFLDRGDDDHTALIRDLCGTEAYDVLEEMAPADLLHSFNDDVEPADLLAAQIEEARRVLDDDPEWALRRIRSAHRLLEQAARSDVVIDDLIAEAGRVRGIAAALVVLRRGIHLEPAVRTQHVEEATKWLDRAGSGELYELIQRLGTALLDHPVSEAGVATVLEATRRHHEVLQELPELEGPTRTTLLRWTRAIPAPERPTSAARVDAVLDAVKEVASTFEDRNPELHGEFEQLVESYAEHAETTGNVERALALYRRADTVDPLVEARCLVALERWDEAAEIFGRAGMAAEELRCVRQIPDFHRAAGLAESVDLGVANKMRWALSLSETLTSEALDVGVPLTDAEHDTLVECANEGLARARNAVPGKRSDPAAATATSDAADDALIDPEATVDGSEVESVYTNDESRRDDTGSDQMTEIEDAPDEVDLGDLLGVAGAEIMRVADVAQELGITETTCLELCSKLGIPARNGESTVTNMQAGRVAGRAELEGLLPEQR